MRRYPCEHRNDYKVTMNVSREDLISANGRWGPGEVIPTYDAASVRYKWGFNTIKKAKNIQVFIYYSLIFSSFYFTTIYL